MRRREWLRLAGLLLVLGGCGDKNEKKEEKPLPPDRLPPQPPKKGPEKT